MVKVPSQSKLQYSRVLWVIMYKMLNIKFTEHDKRYLSPINLSKLE
jgi:hypothetical protein